MRKLILVGLIGFAGVANAAGTEEEMIVTGIRGSLQKASDVKRDAPSISDSIQAEDIGKFPDQNIAESLQRITGVSISRENGEGSKITVRGFGSKFNTVQLNGRTLPSGERGKEFDFQVLPAELISGVDIVKASRANVTEGSLGAYINAKTLRPLDSPGGHASLSHQASYQDVAEDLNSRTTLALSNTYFDDTLGFSIAASGVNTSSRLDSYQSALWGRQSVDNELSPNAGIAYENGTPLAATDQFWYPGRLRFAMTEEERGRDGAHAGP